MLSILFLACAHTNDDTETPVDTAPEITVEGENYRCADGGDVTHTHVFTLGVAPGEHVEMSTVYAEEYREYFEDVNGYESPKMTIASEVDLDEDGRVFVLCEWLEVDGYEGRVEDSYTLVVRG